MSEPFREEPHEVCAQRVVRDRAAQLETGEPVSDAMDHAEAVLRRQPSGVIRRSMVELNDRMLALLDAREGTSPRQAA